MTETPSSDWIHQFNSGPTCLQERSKGPPDIPTSDVFHSWESLITLGEDLWVYSVVWCLAHGQVDTSTTSVSPEPPTESCLLKNQRQENELQVNKPLGSFASFWYPGIKRVASEIADCGVANVKARHSPQRSPEAVRVPAASPRLKSANDEHLRAGTQTSKGSLLSKHQRPSSW